MTLLEIVKSLGLKVYCGENLLHSEVKGGYVSDLLSDVMGNANEGEVWITLQSHMNVVAIASLKELPAVILVKNINVEEVILKKAVEEGIAILGSPEDTFDVAGKLFELLK
jgi:predicted transcriptional regulator